MIETGKGEIDQTNAQSFSTPSTKTRWPLVELIAGMDYSSSCGFASLGNLNPQALLDIYSDDDGDGSDTKSSGRRKNKIDKKRFNDNDDEKYPKLESVLEDTG